MSTAVFSSLSNFSGVTWSGLHISLRFAIALWHGLVVAGCTPMPSSSSMLESWVSDAQNKLISKSASFYFDLLFIMKICLLIIIVYIT